MSKSEHSSCWHCQSPGSTGLSALRQLSAFRRVLWWALALNTAMFLVQTTASRMLGSSSLTADSVDFGADALNYSLTLGLLGAWFTQRARAARLKVWLMGLTGAVAIGQAFFNLEAGHVPPSTGLLLFGGLAMGVNTTVALKLHPFRNLDANAQGAWLCSRNDALANFLILMAASGTAVWTSAWPDALLGVGLAFLSFQGAWQLSKKIKTEMSQIS